MKCKKTEFGIELVAESDYEQECLKHLDSKKGSLTINFEDSWNKSGTLKIEGKPHPWDERR